MYRDEGVIQSVASWIDPDCHVLYFTSFTACCPASKHHSCSHHVVNNICLNRFMGENDRATKNKRVTEAVFISQIIFVVMTMNVERRMTRLNQLFDYCE